METYLFGRTAGGQLPLVIIATSHLTTKSQNSSSFTKSVCFDIEDDSAPDSGVVTETSTPCYPDMQKSQ